MHPYNLLISVIVPVYNVESYIRQCLDSIIGQTYPHLEIILIDDGSTDNSGIICDEYSQKDQRIIVIHKDNGGLSSARNAGLGIASGTYIAFVDSDDWLDRETYKVCQECIIANGSPDIIMYGYKQITPNNISSHIWNSNTRGIQDAICGLMNTTDFIPSVWSRLFKKEKFFNLKFYQGRVYEDVSFSLLAHLIANTFIYLPLPLYNYRSNSSSISFTMKENIIDLYLNLEDLLYQIKDSYPQWVPIINATRIRWLQAHYPEIKKKDLKPERFKKIFIDMRRFSFSYTNWKNFISRWSFIHFPELYSAIKRYKEL